MSIFNVRGQSARRAAQGVRLRSMLRLERGLARRFWRELNRQYLAAAALVQAGITDIDIVVEQGAVTLEQALYTYYIKAGTLFSVMVFKEFRKEIAKGAEPEETKTMEEEYWRSFTGYARRNSAAKVVGISATTRRLLRRTIKRGAYEGMSYEELAKEIRKARSSINQYRARRIARTEIHSASTYATDEAVASTRVPMEREWTAMYDERTRFNHRVANGQRRAQGKPFNVGGEHLMFPGDPKGSPGNIINCRCVVMYHSKGEGGRKGGN